MSSIYQQLGDKQGHYSGKYDDLSEKEKKEIDIIAKARLREQERLSNIAKRKNVSLIWTKRHILTKHLDILTKSPTGRSKEVQRGKERCWKDDSV